MIETIYNRIIKRRDELEFNNHSLSLAAGLEKDYLKKLLANIEAALKEGKKPQTPGVDKLMALAIPLKCSVSYLVGETDDVNDSGPATAAAPRENVQAAAYVDKYLEKHNIRRESAIYVLMVEEVKIAIKTQPKMNDYVLGLIYKNAKATAEKLTQEETRQKKEKT
jgi:transcriptional regulator with XRE-family HTH domain